jgi:hypothetical protein
VRLKPEVKKGSDERNIKNFDGPRKILKGAHPRKGARVDHSMDTGLFYSRLKMVKGPKKADESRRKNWRAVKLALKITAGQATAIKSQKLREINLRVLKH